MLSHSCSFLQSPQLLESHTLAQPLPAVHSKQPSPSSARVPHLGCYLRGVHNCATPTCSFRRLGSFPSSLTTSTGKYFCLFFHEPLSLFAYARSFFHFTFATIQSNKRIPFVSLGSVSLRSSWLPLVASASFTLPFCLGSASSPSKSLRQSTLFPSVVLTSSVNFVSFTRFCSSNREHSLPRSCNRECFAPLTVAHFIRNVSFHSQLSRLGSTGSPSLSLRSSSFITRFRVLASLGFFFFLYKFFFGVALRHCSRASALLYPEYHYSHHTYFIVSYSRQSYHRKFCLSTPILKKQVP